MNTAGFFYTNNGDIARCNTCELEVSGWTSDMNPFTIHKQRSPTCSFVRSVLSFEKTTAEPAIKLAETTAILDDTKQPLKRPEIDTAVTTSLLYTFVELDSLKQVRKRTFSHWPHRSSPSAFQMIQAGFFNCNVGDRIICIYCNIICQQWTPNSDDPCEVHRTLSRKCPYVVAMLTVSQTSPISIINEASASADLISSQSIVYTTACNPAYIEIPKRMASFATWLDENMPSIDDLVRAGFFFTGTKTIVTCFYCNGSLQNWGVNDNPMIEHARWFPHCAYAKQLCGADLHQKIQESKRAQQERARLNDVENPSTVDAVNASSGRLLILDESTLSRLVAARLDLPISQSLLDRNFKLSIIKRCWEDQLRLKREDFVSDSDLLLACIILQKQIEHIDGKKDNITVPSVAMKRIREKKQADACAHEQAAANILSANSSENNMVKTTHSLKSELSERSDTVLESTGEKMKNMNSSAVNNTAPKGDNNLSLTNPCVMCLKEEKRLACIPCGHLITCTSCAQSVRSCPVCHRGIEAFVRIYL